MNDKFILGDKFFPFVGRTPIDLCRNCEISLLQNIKRKASIDDGAWVNRTPTRIGWIMRTDVLLTEGEDTDFDVYYEFIGHRLRPLVHYGYVHTINSKGVRMIDYNRPLYSGYARLVDIDESCDTNSVASVDMTW